MKKPKKSKNLKIIATGLASASLLSGCGPSRPKEPKEVQDWRKAPGTNGFINLGDVVKAFNTHKKAEDFEKRTFHGRKPSNRTGPRYSSSSYGDGHI